MTTTELLALKGQNVMFRNDTTRRDLGDFWMRGTLETVMSELVTFDGFPYSRSGLEVKLVSKG